MGPIDILARSNFAAADAHPVLEIVREGNRITFRTSEHYVRLKRLAIRAAGVAAVFLGTVLAAFTLWGVLVAACGAATFFLARRFVRPARLLEVDSVGECLSVVQPSARRGAVIPLEHVAAVRGVYEVKGWDGCSLIQVVLTNGVEVPVMVFQGTNEALATYACRTLGYLLDRPATYAGPFGPESACYTPAESDRPMPAWREAR